MTSTTLTPNAEHTGHHRAGRDGTAARVELDVVQLGEDGWRVSIAGADQANPFALLGFVSLVDGRYEVDVIGQPGRGAEMLTLDAALDALRPEPHEVPQILMGIRH